MGPMGQALFAHSASFGFPSSSASSSSAFPTSASHANAGENVGKMEQEMEREGGDGARKGGNDSGEGEDGARARGVCRAREDPAGEGGLWEGRDRLERFAVYRRDVGIRWHYILRDDLLVFLVPEAEAAAAGVERVRGMWEGRARLRVDRNVCVRRASWDAGSAGTSARRHGLVSPRADAAVWAKRAPRPPSLPSPSPHPHPSDNPLLLPDTTLTLALTRTPLHRRSKPPSTASASCTRRSTSLRRPLSPPAPRLKRASSARKALRGGVHNGANEGIQGPGGQGQGQGGEGEALAVQRLRRTALELVDTYAGYFTTRAPDALLPLLQYVLGALADADGGFVWRTFAPLRSFWVLRESVCAFASGAGRRFPCRERLDVPRYPAFPRICIGIRAMHGFCAYRGRRDAHFLFGTRMWCSGLGCELGITNGFRLCTGGLGSASSLSLASLLLVNLLTTVPWFLQAALALRSLCDANRRALASRIDTFAEDLEKGKVLQSIASVIQALPPAEAVAPVEAMVGRILQRLGTALGAVGRHSSRRTQHPEAARLAAILQLEILAGVAKGLTRTADPMAFDEEDGGAAEADAARAAREDPWRSCGARMRRWGSELLKAITALPADVTLLSLPAGSLLDVVCRAVGRRLNGVWLALAAILIAQPNPPPLILTLKSGPSEEAEAGVREAVGGLVTAALGLLGAPGGMVEADENAEPPDIMQEFFACMDRVAQDFTAAFCALPDGAFDALMQCAISALALQERYSLVAAATFLGTLIHRVALYAPISPEQLQLLQAHLIRTHRRAIMRAVLRGFAGADILFKKNCGCFCGRLKQGCMK
ncbi:hypothetical protein B0H13DRAFT_2559570 [Mycena leptocephala]|nr:hypothetical protein B0H13DRAFT_2559570 [Mycena leptocephala]